MKKIIFMVVMSWSLFSATAYAQGQININTANIQQLEMVKGIGEKTAAAIVRYRETHGAFASVGDLIHVKGIGEKKLDNIDDGLVVE